MLSSSFALADQVDVKLTGKVNGTLTFAPNLGSNRSCSASKVAGKDVYTIDFTSPGRGTGWMDKLEISINADNFVSFNSGAATKLTSGSVTLLLRDQVRVQYRAFITRFKPCDITVQKTGSTVTATVNACALNSDIANPFPKKDTEIVVSATVSCNDGEFLKQL